MNQAPFSNVLSPSVPSPSPDRLECDLAALMDDIQRTRAWLNTQMDAQLASLQQIQTAMQIHEPPPRHPMAALFEAPPPVMELTPAEPPVAVAPKAHAVVLSPAKTASLDPDLEQATLQELNTALSRAFAEISARGGLVM